ncbi:MAG: hypothetical protein M1118_16025 [Chloroflexi bacterium]|nr:hypothetical protein [Chloroflexota bacterium]
MASDQQAMLNRHRAGLTATTAGFLEDADEAHRQMAASQRASLEAGFSALRESTAGTLHEFHDARVALASNLIEFHRIWQGFAGEMLTNRSGTSFAVEPTTASTSAVDTPAQASEPISTPAIDTPVQVPEPISTPTIDTPVQVPESITDEEVFRYLADHPDGVRLVDLEQHFRASRQRLLAVITRLIEGNKARKDEERRLYIAM